MAYFKAHANGRNKSQHRCVLLANNVASVYMGLKTFDPSQTIRNKCQHYCVSMQTDATCWSVCIGPILRT